LNDRAGHTGRRFGLIIIVAPAKTGGGQTLQQSSPTLFRRVNLLGFVPAGAQLVLPRQWEFVDPGHALSAPRVLSGRRNKGARRRFGRRMR